jgi:hypothetical protein
VGTSTQAVNTRSKEGLFDGCATYREWLTVYIEKLRAESAGRSDKDLAEIRARKELAQARREELELAKEMRLVVLSEEVAPGIAGILNEVQLQIIQAAKRGLNDIKSEHQIKIDDDAFLGHIRAALRSVGGSGDQLIATISGKPERAVTTAIDTDSGVDREKSKAAGGE